MSNFTILKYVGLLLLSCMVQKISSNNVKDFNVSSTLEFLFFSSLYLLFFIAFLFLSFQYPEKTHVLKLCIFFGISNLTFSDFSHVNILSF